MRASRFGAVAGSVRIAPSRSLSYHDIPFVRDPDGTFHDVVPPNFEGGNGNAINIWGAMVGNLLLTTDNNSAAATTSDSTG